MSWSNQNPSNEPSESSHLVDSLVKTLKNADADWKNVCMVMPEPKTQSLIYEYAEHLAIRSLLKIVDLPITARHYPNAVDMSPTGHVPFLLINEKIVAGYSNIVEFIELKGIKLSTTRTPSENTDIVALSSLIDEDLRHLEMYVTWIDDETYHKVTKPRTASVYTFPLDSIVPRIRRNTMRQYLVSRQYAKLTEKQVGEKAEAICLALSQRLGSRKYFVGETASELDAVVFGHLFTILTTELPCLILVNAIKKYPTLIDFVARIEEELFPNRQ
uniref:Thioredoxin-like_fold domain-containing protein n=1 Tax=Panagrellus redivivus TaxID=6233 RepID=A0A7E4UNR5_PANRE